MRVTSQDLLMAGWHSIYVGRKTYWSHPNFNNMISFRLAVAVLKENGVDKYGCMI